MLRLFTGIRLPLYLRQQLSLLQGGIPGARWTNIEDYHITLSFIGNVDEATAEDIDEVLSGIRIPTFKLSLKGAGCFTRGDTPGYLWIGIEHNELLHRLKEKIDHILEAHKLPFEKRKYTPHVTVARLKNSTGTEAAEFIQRHNLFTGGPFEVDEFTLYQSHHVNEGPTYEELTSYPLSYAMVAQTS